MNVSVPTALLSRKPSFRTPPHRYTDYEDQLDTSYREDQLLDELTYRAVKSAANQAVDNFIAAHRDVE